jgi:hypothetical protein
LAIAAAALLRLGNGLFINLQLERRTAPTCPKKIPTADEHR